MIIIFFIRRFLFLMLFLLISCTANKIIVHVETVDSFGKPLNDVLVKVSDPMQCCSGDDKPCSFTIKNYGSLEFKFVDGKAINSKETKRQTCEIVLSKTGYVTSKESFSFCVYGPCTGEQNIKLKIKMTPTE